MSPHIVDQPTISNVRIRVDGQAIDGDLAVPANAKGLVIFAHGSGSGRFSPRNRMVADALNGRQLATLLLDLLTPDEEARDAITREQRFDIGLLSGRVATAVDWAGTHVRTKELPIGLFGASTGAAAALVAAALRPDRVGAVVSRGGRPDLAGAMLGRVRAPTLLIVGGFDDVVIDLNRRALAQLNCSKRLSIVPGATHLFEEPGTLDQVCRLAEAWFEQHLGREQ
jgi:pimeloyl-ACP methyl ester carboxylesterase